MTAPTPVLDPSGRPDRPHRRDRRHRRDRKTGTALFVGSMILLVVALGTAGAALVVRHDTSELQSRAEPVRRGVRDLAATEETAARRLRLLREQARATNEALAALFAAELAQVDASNHAVDVANQAVDQYNNAVTTDVAAAFASAGDAAITDLEEKSAAVRGAAEAVQRAIASLQGVADG